MIEPTESEKSLTRGMYHLRTARDYLDVFKIDCNQNGKVMVNGWINKINYILSNVRVVIREENRNYFDKEIMNPNDILFFGSIADKFFHLTDQQRLLIEDLVDSFIRGEKFGEPKNNAA